MGSRLDPRASSGGLGLITAAQVCAGHAWAARSPESGSQRDFGCGSGSRALAGVTMRPGTPAVLRRGVERYPPPFTHPT